MEPEPSLVTLPVELQMEIIQYLGFPDIICLRMTCRRFSSLIPPLSHGELLKAEISAFGFENNLYSCSQCLRLRAEAKFSDKMVKYRKGKFGRDKGKRFCFDCGRHVQP